jgi:glycosyltransferase involved in cell wall biosynthesis
MGVSISTVICTYNRAGYLRKALQSLTDQSLPKEQYEVIVVDNCSTDNTKQMIEEEFKHLTHFRYLFEPILGANHARNRGWRNAQGKYVAFMDSDVIASPQWLEKILEVFETVRPQPGCVGGKIQPIWEANRPAWLSDKLIYLLSILNISETPIVLDPRQLLVGGNMAFPKHVLEEIGGFHVFMTRTGKKLLTLDENLEQQRLGSRGYHLYYHPEIAVWHHILASRLTKSWFRRRTFWLGLSEATAQLHEEPFTSKRRLRMALYRTRKLLLSPRQWAYLVMPTNNPEYFSQKCSVLRELGYILKLVRIAG